MNEDEIKKLGLGMAAQESIEIEGTLPLIVPLKGSKIDIQLVIDVLEHIMGTIRKYMKNNKFLSLFVDLHRSFEHKGKSTWREYQKGVPLLSFITSKLKYKDFLYNNFKDIFNIKIHGFKEDKPFEAQKVIYYTLTPSPKAWIPVYRKNDSRVDLDNLDNTGDPRDRELQLFEYFEECVEEAF